MPDCATYDDVNLVMRLYELRREDRLREARRWFFANLHASSLEEFDQLCPPGSTENESFRMVASYWEMAASFVTSGVLQKDVFFESGRELLVVWERLKDVIPAARSRAGDAAWFKNLELVAKDYSAWMNQRAPGSYEAFSERIRKH